MLTLDEFHEIDVDDEKPREREGAAQSQTFSEKVQVKWRLAAPLHSQAAWLVNHEDILIHVEHPPHNVLLQKRGDLWPGLLLVCQKLGQADLVSHTEPGGSRQLPLKLPAVFHLQFDLLAEA